MTIQEQLLKAAGELNYDDECGGRATTAFRNHLRMIAAKTPELEAAGFEVKVDLDPRHAGSSKVWLARNATTVELYNVFYDRYSALFGGRFFDEDRGPLEKRLEMALKVAQMFARPTA
jgi:hypothetical protein